MILPVDEGAGRNPEWWVLAGTPARSKRPAVHLPGHTRIDSRGELHRTASGSGVGGGTNALVVVLAAGWPVLVVSLATTSIPCRRGTPPSPAWLMRSMGKWNYRQWMSERLDQGHRPLAWACHLGEAAPFGMLGLALLWFSRWQLVPYRTSGLASHSVAVAGFTPLSLWRSPGRESPGERQEAETQSPGMQTSLWHGGNIAGLLRMRYCRNHHRCPGPFDVSQRFHAGGLRIRVLNRYRVPKTLGRAISGTVPSS